MKDKLKNAWELWNEAGGPKYPHEKVIQYTFRNFPPGTRSGKSALDLGCGNGVHSVFLASEGFDVEFCDVSKIGVSNTIKAMQSLSLNYCDHQVASIGEFENKDCFFDYIVCTGVFDSAGLSEATACIEKVSMALKHGARGIFIFASAVDFRICDQPNALKLHGYTHREVEELFGKVKWSRLNIDRYITTFENGAYQSNDFLVTVVK